MQLKGADVQPVQSLAAEVDFLLITTPSKKASTLAFKLAKRLGVKAQTFVHVGFSSETLESYEALGLKDLLANVSAPQIVARRNQELKAYSGENQGEAIEAWVKEVFA